jgi:hypothetical protein
MGYLGDDGNLSDVSEEDVERAGRKARAFLEEGWYRCALVEDEVQVKPWGTGLNMQFQVLSGEFTNQRIFDYLCVRHSRSDDAERIARAKLKAFGIAVGAKNPDDMSNTDPYMNKPLMLEVIREAPKDAKYGDAEDGKQARVGRVLSVAKWKEEHADEPTPGVGVRNGAAPKPAAPPPPAVENDDIPF